MLRVVVDTREQAPYRFAGYEVEVVRAGLPVGDYSLPGFEDRVMVERKSLDDLLGCLTDGRARFERELARARSYELAVVVVEAPFSWLEAGRYRSQMNPRAAVASVAAFQVRWRPVSFWFAGTRRAAERVTFELLSKYAREVARRMEVLRGNQPVEV